MEKMDKLRERIEAAREELEQSLEDGDRESVYEKSMAMDQLIEEYMDRKKDEAV